MYAIGNRLNKRWASEIRSGVQQREQKSELRARELVLHAGMVPSAPTNRLLSGTSPVHASAF